MSGVGRASEPCQDGEQSPVICSSWLPAETMPNDKSNRQLEPRAHWRSSGSPKNEHIHPVRAISKNGKANKMLVWKIKSRFLRARLWHAGVQLLAMCWDELTRGMPKQRPFPIKALDDCVYGGFVYLQFFFVEMWGPSYCKYQLRHVGLTRLQLQCNEINMFTVPYFSQWINVVHQYIFQASKQFVIHYKFTQMEKSFHYGKLAFPSLFTIYLLRYSRVKHRLPPLTFTDCQVFICDFMEKQNRVL